ncbi:MAG: carboxylating nicotinate-nucleotide diphosphorylase [Pseudomonadota bacterium]
MKSPLPDSLLTPPLLNALAEDIGQGGDLTSLSTIDPHKDGIATLNARENGIVAGISAARLTFSLVDPACNVTCHVQDGDPIEPGTTLLTATGPAQGLLTAERTALNILSHLSGVATLTSAYVGKVHGTKARIAGTRKTLPGLRVLQKHAIRAGGGMTHRMSLSDAVMIKDNHIVAAGSIEAAITNARAFAGHTVKIEVEVDTLAQLDEALRAKPDIVLLDNMSTDDLSEAVRRASGQTILEASGGVTLDSVQAIAATGVDIISVGALTHSARSIDIGMELSARS